LRELALHLLDIAENSVSSNAQNILIEVGEDTRSNRLYFVIQDDGVGMDSDTVAQITDPFVTSRTTRKVGLGIPLLKAAAEACNGNLKINSTPGKGTSVEVEFQRNHIDLMPLGNIACTIQTLVIGSPEIHWQFIYRANEQVFEFDDEFIKQVLGDIPLSEPGVITYIREYLQDGINSIQPPQSIFESILFAQN